MRESVWEEEAATLKQILQDAGETDIDYSLHYRLVIFILHWAIKDKRTVAFSE